MGRRVADGDCSAAGCGAAVGKAKSGQLVALLGPSGEQNHRALSMAAGELW